MHAPNTMHAQPLEKKKNFNDRVLECSINNLHILHAATMQVSVGFAVQCVKHHCAEYLRQLLECNTVQGWVPAIEHTQAYYPAKGGQQLNK